MERKLILIAFLFVVIASATARNDLILGTNSTNQVLLYQQYHNVSGIPGQIVTFNYNFSNMLRNITRFRALDQVLFGTGGFASIIAGGIGHYNVTYNLRASAFGRGYSFFVDIYGV